MPFFAKFPAHEGFFFLNAPEQDAEEGGAGIYGKPGVKDERNSGKKEGDSQIARVTQVAIYASLNELMPWLKCDPDAELLFELFFGHLH